LSKKVLILRDVAMMRWGIAVCRWKNHSGKMMEKIFCFILKKKLKPIRTKKTIKF
jgi:hypothetical protein